MTQVVLKELYFNWICELVCTNVHIRSSSYTKLLKYLDSVNFNYILDMDGNREADGIDLRYRFGYENDISDHEIAASVDVMPCSVLEMMAALALKCEESIMDSPEMGNRTGVWFWEMIKSLGLSSMTNSSFSKRKADRIMETFLNREYSKNGEGGLFTLPNCKKDLRTVEIWYQAMWYFDEILDV